MLLRPNKDYEGPAAMVEAEAAGALWALSENHTDNKVSIAGSGAISTLCGLLASSNERAQKHAASALASLSFDRPENQQQVASILVSMLMTSSDATQKRTCKALWRVVKENPETQFSIAKAGGAETLVAEGLRKHSSGCGRHSRALFLVRRGSSLRVVALGL